MKCVSAANVSFYNIANGGRNVEGLAYDVLQFIHDEGLF